MMFRTLLVPDLIERCAEDDIVLQRAQRSTERTSTGCDETYLDSIVLYPGLLRSIRDTALPREVDERVGSCRDVVHLTE